jgi:transcriptional regulator with XRE-family HTH domain
MIERIIEIMRRKNISPSQFADEIGIQRSGMSHLISGRNKPSLEFVLKVLKRFPDTDPVWFLLGVSKQDGNIENSVKTEPLMSNDIDKTSDKTGEFPFQELDGFNKGKDLIEKIIVLYGDNSFKEYRPK